MESKVQKNRSDVEDDPLKRITLLLRYSFYDWLRWYHHWYAHVDVRSRGLIFGYIHLAFVTRQNINASSDSGEFPMIRWCDRQVHFASKTEKKTIQFNHILCRQKVNFIQYKSNWTKAKGNIDRAHHERINFQSNSLVKLNVKSKYEFKQFFSLSRFNSFLRIE